MLAREPNCTGIFQSKAARTHKLQVYSVDADQFLELRMGLGSPVKHFHSRVNWPPLRSMLDWQVRNKLL